MTALYPLCWRRYLHPCPFCGTRDHLIAGWVHALGVGVTCLKCGTRTKSFDLPEYSSKRNVTLRLVWDAITRWNRRPGNPDGNPPPPTSRYLP